MCRPKCSICGDTGTVHGGGYGDIDKPCISCPRDNGLDKPEAVPLNVVMDFIKEHELTDAWQEWCNHR